MQVQVCRFALLGSLWVLPKCTAHVSAPPLLLSVQERFCTVHLLSSALLDGASDRVCVLYSPGGWEE